MTRRVIIVGAGYAGLSSAIELHTRGFEVVVYESAKKFEAKGDILNTYPSFTRLLARWGNILEKIEAMSSINSHQTVRDAKGNVLLSEDNDFVCDGFPTYITPRGFLHIAIYEYAISIGIEIYMNTPISEAFEEDDCAGVVVDGRRVFADMVIGADGVHSKIRTKMLQAEEPTHPSGYSIYRTMFSTERFLDNPKAHDFISSCQDSTAVWIGTNANFVLFPIKQFGKVCIIITHTDDHTTEESWTYPGRVEDILELVKDWDETVYAIASCIPGDELYDWKMVCRDPLESWPSKKGKILLIGDAVHLHLPTSGSGAMQAMEDGATIAALLDKLRDESISDVTKCFQLLRYDRVNCTQHLGWEQLYRLHSPQFQPIKTNSQAWSIYIKGEWILNHDVVRYTEENAELALRAVKGGAAFKNTNIPNNYIPVKWTVRGIKEAAEKGRLQSVFQ